MKKILFWLPDIAIVVFTGSLVVTVAGIAPLVRNAPNHAAWVVSVCLFCALIVHVWFLIAMVRPIFTKKRGKVQTRKEQEDERLYHVGGIE